MTEYKVVVNKSNVPVSTAEKMHSAMLSELERRIAPLATANESNKLVANGGIFISSDAG